MKLTNCRALIKAGQATRFGPSWPGRRCGAKTRAGGPCQNPAIGGRKRCTLHGGPSTGPKSEVGKRQIVDAHLKHGRRSRAYLEKVRAINAELRRVILKGRRSGIIP